MKRLVCVVLLLGLIAGTKAENVTSEMARCAANSFLKHAGPSEIRLADLGLRDISATTPFRHFYTFVGRDGDGYVLIAADNSAYPILGYSGNSRFDMDQMPDHVRAWLENYDHQLADLQDSPRPASPEVARAWEALLNDRPMHTTLTTSIAPLMTTRWSQSSYYNSMCPIDHRDHCLVGCVAVAMGQVMKYWDWPVRGTDSNAYTYNGMDISAHFDSADYQWDDMPDTLTSASTTTQVNAVAHLLFHAGVAVNMMYGIASSYAYTANGGSTTRRCAENALQTHFGYKASLHGIVREHYSDPAWCQTLRDELDMSRPIIYSAQSTSSGHCFVLDGYDTQGQFHVNWGWGGHYDGYFRVGALAPYDGSPSYGAYNWNMNDAALIGIEPDPSTTTTTTITAIPNNSQWGTVTGGGTFGSTTTSTTLRATAQSGYRFARWSDGVTYNPRAVHTYGGSYTYTATFEPLQGDTLGYCYDEQNGSYGYVDGWGIRLPVSVLSAGSYLYQVQAYLGHDANAKIEIYEGGLENRFPLYSEMLPPDLVDGWHTIDLTSPVYVSGLEDIYITIRNVANPSRLWAPLGRYTGNGDGGWMLDTYAWQWTNNQNRTVLMRGIFTDSIPTHYCPATDTLWVGDTSNRIIDNNILINSSAYYTVSETLIDGDEIGSACTLRALCLELEESASQILRTNCDIYIQPTTRSTFASATDYEPFDSTTAVRVHTGQLTLQRGWNQIQFDMPYEYNGVGNLMIIIDDNSGRATSAIPFVTSDCNSNKSIQFWGSRGWDIALDNPTAQSTAQQCHANRPIMKLVRCLDTPIVLSPCPTPPHYNYNLGWVESNTQHASTIPTECDHVFKMELDPGYHYSFWAEFDYSTFYENPFQMGIYDSAGTVIEEDYGSGMEYIPTYQGTHYLKLDNTHHTRPAEYTLVIYTDTLCDYGYLNFAPSSAWQNTYTDEFYNGGCRMHSIAVVAGNEYQFAIGCNGHGSADFTPRLSILPHDGLTIVQDSTSCPGGAWVSCVADSSQTITLRVEDLNGSTGLHSFSIGYRIAGLDCAEVPDYDFVITPAASWQTHSSTVAANCQRVYRINCTAGQPITCKTGCNDGAYTSQNMAFYLTDSTGRRLATASTHCSNGRALTYTPTQGLSHVYLVMPNTTSNPVSYTMAYKTGYPCRQIPEYDYNLNIYNEDYWSTASSRTIHPQCQYLFKTNLVAGYNYQFKTGCGDDATANFDTYLQLLDASGNILAENDDYCDSLSYIQHTITSTGTYYIAVSGNNTNRDRQFTLAYFSHDTACTVIPNYDYTLDIYDSVRTLSGNSDRECGHVFRFPMTANTIYHFATDEDDWFFMGLYDENGESFEGIESESPWAFSFASDRSQYGYLRVRGEGSYRLSYFKQSCMDVPNYNYTIEPDSSWQTHTAETDRNCWKIYRFEADPYTRYIFDLGYDGMGAASFIPQMQLYDRQGNEVQNHLMLYGGTKAVFDALDTGTYLLKVSGEYYSEYGSYTLAYTQEPLCQPLPRYDRQLTVDTVSHAVVSYLYPNCWINYRVDLDPQYTYTFSCYSEYGGMAYFSHEIQILDSAGNWLLDTPDANGNYQSAYYFTPASAGTYYVRVRGEESDDYGYFRMAYFKQSACLSAPAYNQMIYPHSAWSVTTANPRPHCWKVYKVHLAPDSSYAFFRDPNIVDSNYDFMLRLTDSNWSDMGETYGNDTIRYTPTAEMYAYLYVANYSDNRLPINVYYKSTPRYTVRANSNIWLTHVTPPSQMADSGAVVRIWAYSAFSEYRFDHWFNETTGTIIPCDSSVLFFAVTQNTTITAHFVEIITLRDTVEDCHNQTLMVATNNEALGSCSGAGSFPYGSTVQIMAIPAQGTRFLRWSDGNTENPRTVVLNGSLTFTAIFEQEE